jgi:hypothetical protein
MLPTSMTPSGRVYTATDMMQSFMAQQMRLAHCDRDVNAMHGIGTHQLVGHQNLSVHDVESGVLAGLPKSTVKSKWEALARLPGPVFL